MLFSGNNVPWVIKFKPSMFSKVAPSRITQVMFFTVWIGFFLLKFVYPQAEVARYLILGLLAVLAILRVYFRKKEGYPIKTDVLYMLGFLLIV